MIYNNKLRLYEILYVVLILLLPISSRITIANNLSLTFIIMGLLIFIFIIEIMANKRIKLNVDKFIIILIYIFMILNLASYIFSDSKLDFMGALKNFIIPIMLGFFTFIFLDSKKKLYILIRVLVYSGVLVSILNSLQMVVIFNTLGYKGTGPLGNPNYFAGIMVCLLPLAIYESKIYKSVISNVIIFIYISGIIMSFSKSSWIGMIITILILYIKDFKKFIIYIPIFVLFISIFWNGITNKFDLNNIIQNTINGFDGGSRVILLKVALSMSMSNIINFLFGVGLGNFPINTYKYEQLYTLYHPGSESHNIITDILCETGIIGLCIFIILIYRIFRILMSSKLYDHEMYRYLNLVLIQIILYTITHGAGRTFFYLWIFIGISIKLIGILKMENQMYEQSK